MTSGRQYARSQAVILASLTAQIPGFQVLRWRECAVAAFSDEDEDEDDNLAGAMEWMKLMPDGYLIDKEARELHFFEVEVTSPMSTDKLETYAQFLTTLHAFHIGFLLFTVNQYGHVNQVDLESFYLDWLAKKRDALK